MALGGVATGSMKAQETEKVAGIIRRRGCTPSPLATAASIGIIRVAVAVLDVSSVRKVRSVAVAMTRTGWGAPFRTASL